MNIRLALQVLKHLRTRQATTLDPMQRAAATVAVRWLQRNASAEMDILVRLAILEGAANVPAKSWWTGGRRSLSKAQMTFSDVGTALDPAWLTTSDTGVYRSLLTAADRAIKTWKLTGKVEAEDLVHTVLMGESTATGEELGVPKIQFVGQKLSTGIKNGGETPKSAAGFATKLVTQAAEGLARHLGYSRGKNKGILEQQIPVDEDGSEMELGGDVDSDGSEITKLVFGDMNHPISRKLRELMRAAWHDSEPMLKWLDVVEQEMRFPNQSEIAELSGMQAGAFGSRHWKPRWRKFYQVLWQRPQIIRAIEAYFAGQGIEWDFEPPTDAAMDALLKPRGDRPRLASGDIVLDLFGRQD